MTKFQIGQRWISEPEPELGLGIIESVDKNQIRLAFKAVNEVRLYASDNAPIKRVKFCEGDTINTQENAMQAFQTCIMCVSCIICTCKMCKLLLSSFNVFVMTQKIKFHGINSCG